MIRFWCYFSPQNPVGKAVVQKRGWEVVVNLSTVIAY
jgi:hypothetical protein